MNFKTFTEIIPKLKKLDLPGIEGQLKMGPPFRDELMQKYKDRLPNAKQAAIMVIFYPDNKGETHFVLILRKTYKGVHSNQVGFPGGKIEEEDNSFLETAIRETYEEVGVTIAKEQVFKTLTEVYIPPSNFYVHPFMAIVNEKPQFVKQESEVEQIIEVSLSDFLDDNSTITTSVKTSYAVHVKTPAFKLDNHIVWGATAMMLSEVKELLKRAI